MKNETVSDELRLLKNDIVLLKKEIADLTKGINFAHDYLRHNLLNVLDKLGMGLQHQYACKDCEGYGKIYIPPISDCGQDNRCMECKGTGMIWR